MHVLLAANTLRGLAVAREIRGLLPEAALTLVTSRESPPEPAFVEPMRALSLELGFEFRPGLRLEEAAIWSGSPVDLLLMVNWRRLVGVEVLERARRGSYLLHDSLLPLYRGFSPTVWAMVNGENQTGVTLLSAAAEVDAGDVVAQQAVSIGRDDTIATVTERVTQASVNLIDRHLGALAAGTARLVPQDHSRATYACRRLPEDSVIDWSQPAGRVHDLVRAVTRPYAGARTTFKGAPLTIWATRLPAAQHDYAGAIPGRVVRRADGGPVTVLTAGGELDILEVELAAGGAQAAGAVIRSLSDTLGR